jgi:exonuclease III
LLPALLLLLLLLCSYRFNARASNRGWRLDYFLVRVVRSLQFTHQS